MLKKIPALIIIGAFGVSMLLVSTAPRPVKAQWEVSDLIQYVNMALAYASQKIQLYNESAMKVKEYGLDPLAWASEKSALQKATGRTINMVSGGYHDPYTKHTGPMFVTNLLSNLRDNVGAPIANRVISDVGQGGSPFAASVASQIRSNYFNNSSPQGFWGTHKYTLAQIVGNTSQFLHGDFSQGGVNGFLSMVTNPLNNPYGTYFAAQSHLNTKVTNAQSARRTELTYGGGFLSSPGVPGSVVKAQLDKGLSSGISSMVAADEISEVIGILAANLATNALGGSDGIGGFTKPGTNGKSGANSFVNEPPPAKSINTIANTLIKQIDTSEGTLTTYINNWHIILNATQRAGSSLTALISYTPPANITINTVSSGKQKKYDPVKYAACLSDFQLLQPVASASQASVQKIINRGNTVIANAKKALKKFEVIRQELNNALKTKTLAAITKATDDYETLTSISNGLMPSGPDIEYASTQSVFVPSAQGGQGVSSSGIDGLTVTGSTVVSRMPVLSTNATKALAKTKTCFANSISQGLN